MCEGLYFRKIEDVRGEKKEQPESVNSMED